MYEISDNNKDSKESINNVIIKNSDNNKKIENDEELNKNKYDNFNSNIKYLPLLEKIEKKFNLGATRIIGNNNKKIKHTKNFINLKLI